MLNIVNLEEIQSLLLKVPALVRELERRDAGFVGSVKAWLTEIEQVFVNNRLTVAADVAVLRGVIIAAERGVIPCGMTFRKRATPRNIKDSAAADALRRAEEVISAAISSDAARFAEGEKLIRQIVALAARKGLLVQVPGAETHADVLRAIWQSMARDPYASGLPRWCVSVSQLVESGAWTSSKRPSRRVAAVVSKQLV